MQCLRDNMPVFFLQIIQIPIKYISSKSFFFISLWLNSWTYQFNAEVGEKFHKTCYTLVSLLNTYVLKMVQTWVTGLTRPRNRTCFYKKKKKTLNLSKTQNLILTMDVEQIWWYPYSWHITWISVSTNRASSEKMYSIIF